MPASTSPPVKDLRPAVFLDRDGTVIHDAHYLADPAGVRLLPGAAEAVARLNRVGLPVVLVTNQSGIGRGYFSEADFQAVQEALVRLLAKRGARLDAVYHCPHAPDHQPPCDCRKPEPGLFLRAARELRVDPARSWYVGDRVRDVAPAGRLGGTGILLRGPAGEGETPPPGVGVAGSLAEAVERILVRVDAP
jgi:D-glycero-D-manno-heptose 1,7-bisphosphate phosphatase